VWWLAYAKIHVLVILPFLKGVPAGGGIFRRWIPASAGMTSKRQRNDKYNVILAHAGIQGNIEWAGFLPTQE